MSMREYAFQDYGMVLNGLADEELLEELYEAGEISEQYLQGEATPLDDRGRPDSGVATESFDGETVYYLQVPNYPNFFEAAYPDMDALVDDLLAHYKELRKKCAELPSLTAKDVRGKLRSIEGVYCG